ncbi:hypothetical protein XU18_2885 [Perkinsela sp. CCAP 1560/4]|nr:hypothetical protein XU18_2885 [Perkinsela sp. CCAP 1560/4]|eukprot:KNH06380.1 hypothetical protein XU18_2885 [Perkinsela sp. CCAP 1560/4]
MFFLTRRKLGSTSLLPKSTNFDVILRAVQKGFQSFKYTDCAFCLKGLRDLCADPAEKHSATERGVLQDAENKILDRLKSEPADYFSITIWAQSLQNCDVDAFVEKLQNDNVIERLNTFSIASILVSLARLNWRDEYLIDRLIIRINKTPHQLTSQAISNILNSLIKLRYENPEVIDIIFKEGAKKRDFTPQGLATALNAISHFASLSIASQQAFVDTLVEAVTKSTKTLGSQATAIVLNALSKLHVSRETEVVKGILQWLPNVIPACDGHSVALLCKALTSYNVIADEHFNLISHRLAEVLKEINEQGMHFVLEYFALFKERESTEQRRATVLASLSDHLTKVGGSYSSMGITYCLHALAKCQCTSNELMKVTLFNRALTILESVADSHPSRLTTKPTAFNGQEIGVLLNAMDAFQYENQRCITLVLGHINRWLSGFTMTEILTTLWGLAKVRKMIPESTTELEGVVNRLYDRLDYSRLSGRALSTIALSYGSIGVVNEQVLQSIRGILQSHPDQIEMKYLSIILTTLYTQQIPDFKNLLEEAISRMSLNANTAHSNGLARLLHLAKTCAISIPPNQVESICALVEIIFPKIKPFELSHILGALRSFSPSKAAVESLDQYANVYVKQLLKDATRPTLERFIEYFSFSKGASAETIGCLVEELAKQPMLNTKHVEWMRHTCTGLVESYPEVASLPAYQTMREKLKTETT